ncbi:hypothetical protein [Actinokineospora bangkokensis]|uniref:PE domain-containing protein n=1 Tax=Actinokineospora bangkokensis TaxID=1193682 RepID=A0A1Q9LFS2_9PSEU|nr:hypothetical protein [Actinokineospora bangkokensis]OLR90845.1 hypothetical protein BJP25_30235 [Actinokineospora bangkokensis]
MYIDEGAGAPLGPIGKSMADFASSAAAGQFAVSQSGGDALLSAIRTMMTWVDKNIGRLDILSQVPQLGSSNGAQVMGPYVQSVASDGEGFLTQLTAFRESLVKAEEGITQAMANYQQVDNLNASKLV